MAGKQEAENITSKYMALDQQVVNFAKAIRQVETGNRPVAGASGELPSRYQFMPATWKAEAKRILGDENAPLTLENENKVAYTRIKEWKDKGYRADQVASMWNSGSPDWKGKVGVNSAGVKYDVPSYVAKVGAEYQKLKGMSETQNITPPAEVAVEQPKSEGFIKSLAKGALKPFGELATSVINIGASTAGLLHGDTKFAEEQLDKSRNLPFLGETKPAFTGKEEAGEYAKKIAGYSAEIGSYVVGGGASKVGGQALKTGFGSAIRSGAVLGAKAGGLYGAGEALTENKGLSETALQGIKGVAGGALTGGILGGTTSVAGSVFGKKTMGKLVEMSRPTLSKTEQAQAIASGRGRPATIFGKPEIAPVARDLERAKAIEGIVKPKASKIENASRIRKAIGKEASSLENALKQNDVIFNKNQFKKKLTSIEPELEMQADPIIAKKYELVQNKFMEFVNKNSKNLSGLMKARREFDAWAEQKIPRLWEDPGSKPLHNAIKKMRLTANDFIAEKLPNNRLRKFFIESLKKQNLMFEASDNIAEKAVQSEIGQSMFGAFIKRHPVAKKVAQYGALGVVGGKTAKDLLE